MTTGMGAREQPMTLIITTAGYDITSPCYEKRTQVVEILRRTRNGEENETIFGLIYGLDDDDDWTTPEALIKANPNYGISVKADFLRAKQLLGMSTPADKQDSDQAFQSLGKRKISLLRPEKMDGCSR